MVVAVAVLVISSGILHVPAQKPSDDPSEGVNDQPAGDGNGPADDLPDGSDGQPDDGADSGDDDPATSEDYIIYYFMGDGCPHCAIIEPYIHEIAAKYPQFTLVELEIYHNATNQALFGEFNQRYGVKDPLIPAVFLADTAMIAEDEIQANLEPTIQRVLASG